MTQKLFDRVAVRGAVPGIYDAPVKVLVVDDNMKNLK